LVVAIGIMLLKNRTLVEIWMLGTDIEAFLKEYFYGIISERQARFMQTL
jgi:hypothetical protein